MREAARQAGISIDQFVHEPFAALYGYARRQRDPAGVLDRLQNRLALVFDWGGGTLDLTICERVGDMLVQVQNKGNSDLGGDRFDDRLMHAVLRRHAEQSGWQQLPEMVPGQKARLVNSCEQAKITLSSSQQATVLVRGLFAVQGSGADLEVLVTRNEFVDAVRELVDGGLQEIDALLESAGISPQAIELCLPTGGIVAMPAIRDRLLTLFGPSRCVFVERADTLIADGAAWIAVGDVPLKLAKNIEFRHADQTWVPILKAGQPLPRGMQSSDRVTVNLYCADPRNGFAGIELARPKRATRIQAADPRQSYSLIRVDVQREAPPLRESVELTLNVDPDLVVQVSAVGNATGVEAERRFTSWSSESVCRPPLSHLRPRCLTRAGREKREPTSTMQSCGLLTAFCRPSSRCTASRGCAARPDLPG
ncbi:MAG: Hsp70 family protein [Vicinamibacterales bacterium]